MNRYKKLLVDLDAAGVTASIRRIDKKWYEVHVGFEIRKRYRLRRSANKYIVKLHHKSCIAS